MDRTMFKVEHLDPLLRARNGRFGYYGMAIAERLEKKGHGKICTEGHVGGSHETKVLDAGGSGKYLVKAGFDGTKKERVVLGRTDLFGDQEEAGKGTGKEGESGKSGEEQPEVAPEPDAGGAGEGGSSER